MREQNARIHVRALLAAAMCVALFGCSRDPKAAPPDPSQVKVEKARDPNLIEVDHPERFALITVEQRPVSDEIRVNAVVSPDLNRNVPVLSLAGGRTVAIHTKLGDDVKKGQVLVEIDSPDVSGAFSDYQKFETDNVLAERQLDRAKLLYGKGAIAEKDLEVAQDAADKATVDLKTAAQRLRVLGADPKHPSPIIAVRAPISGTVVEQNTTSGTGVKSLDNSPNLFTIADLSHVWVICDVYENLLPRVHLGDPAEVRLSAYPDQPLRARVGNISRVLDPNTRTAKVRLEVDNPERLMRVGMFATAIFRSKAQQARPVVPAAAVLRLHDRDWVFRSEGGNRFRRVEIEAASPTADGMRPVLAGIAAGDKLAANALQFSGSTEE